MEEEKERHKRSLRVGGVGLGGGGGSRGRKVISSRAETSVNVWNGVNLRSACVSPWSEQAEQRRCFSRTSWKTEEGKARLRGCLDSMWKRPNTFITLLKIERISI